MATIQVEVGAHSLDSASLFCLLSRLLDFVLFIHHQIPDTVERLQHKWADLEVSGQSASQRQLNGKAKKALRETKRVEKLHTAIHSLYCAAKDAIQSLFYISSIVILLGSTPIRPQYVYEIQLLENTLERSDCEPDEGKNLKVENLAKKIIRALISHGAGSVPIGSVKTFLMIKASAASSVPKEFLPRRCYDITNRKIIPFVIQIFNNMKPFTKEEESSTCLSNKSECCAATCISSEMIWFQCKYSVKGFQFKTSE